MADADGGAASREPVERFKPTNGTFIGIATLVGVVILLGYLALRVQSLSGVRIGLGAVFFGCLIWVTQLRPRATAYPAVLRIYNSFRDVVVPFALIDGVNVRETLQVFVGSKRYLCVGIGRPMRSMFRRSGRGAALPEVTPLPSQTSYPDYVQSRIQELAADARERSPDPSGGLTVRHVWAWPEVAATAVTGVAFLVSLFL